MRVPIHIPTEAELPDDLEAIDPQARDAAAVLGVDLALLEERVDAVEDGLEQLEQRVPAVPYDPAPLIARVAVLEGRVDDDVDDAARARISALEARPDDDEDEEARARIATLEARPPGGTIVRDPRVFFEDFGTSDPARVAQCIGFIESRPPNMPNPEIQMPIRVVEWDQQMPTDSGSRFVGTLTPASEFGTGAVIKYTGPAASFFRLKAEAGKYSYPSGGVSRDMHFWGIQFNGGNDKDFLPPAPSTAFDSAYVQWYWTLSNCGFVGWDNFSNGWGTGLTLAGKTHFQAADNSIVMGGSENDWFEAGSLLDSGNLTGDKPALDWSASKSTIGAAMLSARGDSYQLRVTYGHNSSCIGTKFDSPDGAPINGHNVRFTGGTDFGFTGCSFKGGKGILATAGACEIEVTNSGFNGTRDGLARLEAGFSGVLLWGLNRYGNATRTIWAARANQVICSDPRVTVKSLDGSTVFQAATR